VYHGPTEFGSRLPPAETFKLADGYVIDKHLHAALTEVQWNNLANDGIIAEATQELRIVWSDPCGFVHFDQVLQSVHIVHRKKSATTWQVETN